MLLIFVPLKRDFPTKSALKSIRCSEFDQSINFPFEGALKGLLLYCVFGKVGKFHDLLGKMGLITIVSKHVSGPLVT